MLHVLVPPLKRSVKRPVTRQLLSTLSCPDKVLLAPLPERLKIGVGESGEFTYTFSN